MQREDLGLTGLEYSHKLIEQIKKPANIETIKQSIPIIQSLDPSFWDDANFLTWQIIRLNRKYQEFILRLWGKKSKKLVYKLDLFFEDFPPLPGESFEEWNDRLENYCFDYIEKIFEHITSPENNKGLTISKKNFSLFLKSLNKLFNVKFVPIPHTIRFPSPVLLSDFAHYPMERLFKKKGRPTNWGLNLLVYEFSQAGMKDMQIARLLFGVGSSTYLDKHPALVRIENIKKTIGKVVSQAFPLF